MSERASTDCPSTCSGDIYAGVPSTAPGVVSVTSAAGSRRLATPKSRSFAVPPAVTMMFAGFRSRCRMPRSCAACKRAGNLDRDADRVFWRERAPHWLTFEVLQHQIVGSDVVHLADVGVVERRDRPRLALESLPVLGRQLLDRHDALEPGIEGLVDLAHATSANSRLDFVRAETCAGCERQSVDLIADATAMYYAAGL